jgi:hypothetical protein
MMVGGGCIVGRTGDVGAVDTADESGLVYDEAEGTRWAANPRAGRAAIVEGVYGFGGGGVAGMLGDAMDGIAGLCARGVCSQPQSALPSGKSDAK